ncbi:MAG: hypothetical protein ACRDT6_23260 [Micromonosporaceae bacterium]
MSWQRYASLARQLDTVRREQVAAASGQRQQLTSGTADLDQLVDRLTEQQTALSEAARLLRIRMPLIDPPASKAISARDALTQANAAADLADAERTQALQRALAPRFLPDASAVVRNATVYAICAAAALVVSTVMQWAIGDSDPTAVMLWSLLGLPVVAFFVGYLLIGVVGVPRIPPKPPEQDEHGLPVPPERRKAPVLPRHPRLGVAICLLFGPLVWLVLVVL